MAKKVVDKGKAAPVAKKPAAKKAVEAVPEPVWSPSIGEKVQHNGNIIAITSFDPLTAEVFTVTGQVQTNFPYFLESLDGVEPISDAEVFARIG